jgi:hypothetical protein
MTAGDLLAAGSSSYGCVSLNHVSKHSSGCHTHYLKIDKSPGHVSLGIQNQVLDHLLNHWGLENPAIVGHDFGGTTVLRTHPIVFVMAFAGATHNHAMDIVRGGLFPHANRFGSPESLNLYWTSLTVFHRLAILAAIFNVRIGCVFALGIMHTDVPINVHANAVYWSLPIYKNDALLLQTAFLVFLLLTIRRVWRSSGAVRSNTNRLPFQPETASSRG